MQSIRLLRDSDLPTLLALFTRVTANVAHGFAPTMEEFASGFRGPAPNLSRLAVLVAEEDGAITGFTRCGLHRTVMERWQFAQEGDGLLFGPFVTPERLESGRALIQAAEREIAGWGGAMRFAFDPGEATGIRGYNGGMALLSERIPQTVRLLAEAGFRVRHREFNMTRPPEAPPAAQDYPWVDISWKRREENRFALYAYERGVRAGHCHFSRMYPYRSACREAEIWGYIDGLEVVESYRGRGIGRFLMAHALGRMHSLGCGPVALTTGSENHRAQNLYYSLGFQLVDSSITLERQAG